MYAVFTTGGKQYRVAPGDVIFVEKLDAEVESTVEFDQVLAVSKDEGTVVGAPTVEGAKVEAKVLRNGKAKKITVFTYRPKKDSKRKMASGAVVQRFDVHAIPHFHQIPFTGNGVAYGNVFFHFLLAHAQVNEEDVYKRQELMASFMYMWKTVPPV